MDTYTTPLNLRAIADRSDFRKLSSTRNRLGAGLASAMAVIYFTFISFVAFSPAALARPIVPGSSISVGVVAGVAVMACGFMLTAIYVVYASSRLDPITRSLTEGAR